MPIIKLDSPSGLTSNLGTCAKLVSYLEKEDEQKGVIKEYFFNHKEQFVTSIQVQESIDFRKSALGHHDAKFYSGSINLSENELSFLNNDIDLIKKYTIEVFKEYTDNFHRENLTIDNVNWYAKLESHRYYKGNDNEVKNGNKKAGDIKPGINTHVHFIVGRKSVDNKIKLSPKTNHRGTKSGAVKGGFDREEFIKKCEKRFDLLFQYNRPMEESYNYQNEVKNGTIKVKYNNRAKSERLRTKAIKFEYRSNEEQEKKLNKLIQFIRFGLSNQPVELNPKLLLNYAKEQDKNNEIYRSLLNLSQQIKRGEKLDGDLNILVLKYADFINKPYTDLPDNLKIERISSLIQKINNKTTNADKLDGIHLRELAIQNHLNGKVYNALLVSFRLIQNSKDFGNSPMSFIKSQLEPTDIVNIQDKTSIDFETDFVNLSGGIFIGVNYDHAEAEDDDEIKKRKRKRWLNT